MATPSFPAPPDLSELLQFFASTYDTKQQQKAATVDKPELRRADSARRSQQQRSGELKRSTETGTKKPTRRESSPPREAATRQPRASSDWNGSTLISAAIAKPLKHQILDRTFQPPAPVVVDASGTTNLLQRLSKTTVSSRLKRHQADQAAALAAATAVLANAFERRNQHHQHQHPKKSHVREPRYEDDHEAQLPPRVPPDSRARDGIQMLLMYRREVEKRLSADPTHFPSQ